MRSRNFVLLGLVIGLLCSVTALSSNVTIKVLVRPDEGDIVRAYTQKFEAETGIKVIVDFIGWDKIYEKTISVLMAGGAGYDVVFIPSANVAAFAATGQFEPLDDAIPPENRVEWLPSVLDLYTYKGHLVAIPWYSGGAHMVYNARYLARAGVDPASIETWEDFLEACRKIKASGVVEYPFIPSAKYPGNYYYNWGTITYSMGGSLFAEELKPVFNEGAGLKALEILVQGVKEGLFDPAGVAMDDYETLKAFQAGKSAFLLDSTWSATQATLPGSSDVATDAKIMLIPGSQEHRTGGLLYAGGIGVMKSSTHKEEAIAYIMYLTSKEAQMLHAILGANLPTRVDLFNDPEKAAINKAWPIYSDLIEQIKYGDFGPVITWLDPVRRVLATAVQDAMAGRKIPKEALDWAAEEVLELRETYEG